MHDSRAIEQDIDIADLLAYPGNGSFIRHVHNAGPDSLFALELADDLGVHVGSPNFRALAGEGKRGCAAHALACGRDERGFTSEATCHGSRRLYFAFP